MGIRVQPREIDVPQEDPFKHDLLDRKESVESLTQLIGQMEGPCVLAVDAPWGTGKTTFLRIWKQHLRNQKFPVVGFNAWQTDFTHEPFITLSTELLSGLEGLDEDKEGSFAEGLVACKEAAKDFARRALPVALRAAVIPVLGTGMGDALASFAESHLSKYLEYKNSVEGFRNKLQSMAGALSGFRAGRPLVVVIDELDRCRPSYAIELLEVAKHLFAVDHVVFVLGVNRSELAQSVRALYGNEFDAEGYLRRFFDVDFRLRDVERKQFVEVVLQGTGLDNYFRSTNDRTGGQVYEILRNLLVEWFRACNLSLRTIGQAARRLALVVASLGGDQRPLISMTVVLFILRTIDPEVYYRSLLSNKNTNEGGPEELLVV